jgi:hypothetical protein
MQQDCSDEHLKYGFPRISLRRSSLGPREDPLVSSTDARGA